MKWIGTIGPLPLLSAVWVMEPNLVTTAGLVRGDGCQALDALDSIRYPLVFINPASGDLL